MSTMATTADFIVTVDNAQHTVIEQIDADGNVTGAKDFGIFGEVADAANAWLDSEDATRAAMAPMMNAYLATKF